MFSLLVAGLWSEPLASKLVVWASLTLLIELDRLVRAGDASEPLPLQTLQ